MPVLDPKVECPLATRTISLLIDAAKAAMRSVALAKAGDLETNERLFEDALELTNLCNATVSRLRGALISLAPPTVQARFAEELANPQNIEPKQNDGPNQSTEDSDGADAGDKA